MSKRSKQSGQSGDTLDTQTADQAQQQADQPSEYTAGTVLTEAAVALGEPLPPTVNGQRTKRPSNVEYLMIGRKPDGTEQIIGRFPTVGRARKQFEAVRFMACNIYASLTVYACRPKAKEVYNVR